MNRNKMFDLTRVILLLLLAASPRFLAAQTRPDTTAARKSATELKLRADTLRTRADSLSKSAKTLRTTADSILLASGLKKPPVPDNWNGNFGLGYTLNRGNSEQTSLVTTFTTSRKGELTRFSSNSSITNTTSKGGENTNKGSTKNKFELDQSERFFYFAALDAGYNRQAGIDLRLSPGAGVGIAAVAKEKIRLDFNFGANPVTEFLRDQPTKTKGHYLASEALSFQLNGRTALTQSVTWKPRYDATQDYLLNFVISLTSQLTSNFDLNMTLDINYDSRPPVRTPAVKRQDWMFFTSISYSLW